MIALTGYSIQDVHSLFYRKHRYTSNSKRLIDAIVFLPFPSCPEDLIPTTVVLMIKKKKENYP